MEPTSWCSMQSTDDEWLDEAWGYAGSDQAVTMLTYAGSDQAVTMLTDTAQSLYTELIMGSD